MSILSFLDKTFLHPMQVAFTTVNLPNPLLAETLAWAMLLTWSPENNYFSALVSFPNIGSNILINGNFI